jgi:uncharacterized protein (TIGR03492 family)
MSVTHKSQHILLISNGSGEDHIGMRLAQAWRQARPQDTVSALALVGEGTFYLGADIPLRPVHFTPPSQGFAYLHPLKLWHDFCAGLGGHLYRALADISQLRGQVDRVIAVGDIVSVLAATWSQTPYAFVACALSDWYLEPNPRERTCWDPLQLALLRSSRAPVFPRDSLTARHVAARGLLTFDCGNPMVEIGVMDRDGAEPSILMLPGSHRDALTNFQQMLGLLSACGEQPWHLQLIQAPQLPSAAFSSSLSAQGWQFGDGIWRWQKLRLTVLPATAFVQSLSQASAALGLSGTANEQCVAAGIPVLAFVGQGQQYTAAFAEAQQRLLGPGLHLLDPVSPELLRFQLLRVLHHPRYRAAAQQVARERFGPPGAAARIVTVLQREWGL